LISHTYTYVELEVDEHTYSFIEKKLKAAGYNHVFHDGTIDMTGIALTKKPKPPKKAK
jgi:hypothetical protein